MQIILVSEFEFHTNTYTSTERREFEMYLFLARIVLGAHQSSDPGGHAKKRRSIQVRKSADKGAHGFRQEKSSINLNTLGRFSSKRPERRFPQHTFVVFHLPQHYAQHLFWPGVGQICRWPDIVTQGGFLSDTRLGKARSKGNPKHLAPWRILRKAPRLITLCVSMISEFPPSPPVSSPGMFSLRYSLRLGLKLLCLVEQMQPQGVGFGEGSRGQVRQIVQCKSAMRCVLATHDMNRAISGL